MSGCHFGFRVSSQFTPDRLSWEDFSRDEPATIRRGSRRSGRAARKSHLTRIGKLGHWCRTERKTRFFAGGKYQVSRTRTKSRGKDVWAWKLRFYCSRGLSPDFPIFSQLTCWKRTVYHFACFEPPVESWVLLSSHPERGRLVKCWMKHYKEQAMRLSGWRRWGFLFLFLAIVCFVQPARAQEKSEANSSFGFLGFLGSLGSLGRIGSERRTQLVFPGGLR